MFKINKKVEYALIALKYISQKKKDLLSAKDICDAFNTPFDTTSRVLQIMAQNGILKAEHGAYGGYQLMKDLSDVTFLELTEMILGPVKIANCFSKTYAGCELTPTCQIIAPMINLNEKVNDLFRTISVEELVATKPSGNRIIKERSRDKVHLAAANR